MEIKLYVPLRQDYSHIDQKTSISEFYVFILYRVEVSVELTEGANSVETLRLIKCTFTLMLLLKQTVVLARNLIKTQHSNISNLKHQIFDFIIKIIY